MDTNLDMLRNTLSPLLAQNDIEQISIMQGTKAYGVHLHPLAIPARESDARDDHENFYWLQEDYLIHTVEPATLTDAPQLAAAIKGVIGRTGRTPRTVTADRGYGEQRVDDDLQALGVRHVVIPGKGRPNKTRQATEHRRAFRRTVKMAHRQRRTNQHPETRLRLGPLPHRWHRRRPDLDRTRHPCPRPGQDQRTGRVGQPSRRSTRSSPGPHRQLLSPPLRFSGRSS